MSWTERIEKAKDLANTIASDIKERDQFIRSEGAPPARMNMTITRNLHHLSQDLQFLQAKVKAFEEDPDKYQISASEASRRQNDVGVLKRRHTELQSKAETIPETSRKKGPATETEQTQGMTNHSLLQSQEHKLKTFDQDINALSTVARQLGEMGTAIHDELSEQEVIISDIGERMTATEANIQRTDGRLKRLVKKSKNGCMYCMIIILFLVLFALWYL
ncbi:hypothetical protein GEMRC1_011168 [Eukaryota sp. GEM-RC1]